ncbi:MAG: tetratricopeptide repeat protein [Gemmatimonadetes bacterium]|nr:tetratricopeptide repeat protein [Gemmatimonadota bacterium]
MPLATNVTSFLSELRRRKVYHVAAAYAAVAVGVSVAVPDLFNAFGAPAWAAQVVIALLVIGFPVALILAWAVELTPEGIRRTEPLTPGHGHNPASGSPTADGVDEAFASTNGPLHATGSGAGPQVADPRSVAVLPFSDLGADSEYRFFNDGVTEDVLAHLSKVKALRVTSRTSVMRYRGTDKPIRDIAEELGVQHVLEGSVRAVGNRVRVVAQLIDARTDTHLWAETYDRRIEDVFAVQSEVAEAVARALAAELSGAELTEIHEAPTANVTAYALFLEGMAAFDSFQAETWSRAIGLLEGAVAIDPGFARAHAGIALLLTFYPWVTYRLPPRYHDRLKRAATRALELDPESGHAWLGMAAFLWSREREWLEAEEAYARAYELEPDDPTVLIGRAYFNYMLGRFDEAVLWLNRLESSGRSAVVADVYRAIIDVYRADYGEVDHEIPIRQLDALMAAHPDHAMVLVHRAIALERAGRFEDSLEMLNDALRLAPDNALAHGLRGQDLAYTGRMDEARAEGAWFRNIDPESVDWGCWALIPFAAGDVDRGFDLAERGAGKFGSLLLPFLRLVRGYSPLWEHPRFLSLMDAIWPGDQKRVLGPYGWQPRD